MFKQATLSVFIMISLLNALGHINNSNDCDMKCCAETIQSESSNSSQQCCGTISFTCFISLGIVPITKKPDEITKKTLYVNNQIYYGAIGTTLFEVESNRYFLPPPAPPGHMTPLRI
jgi:hypothetical protein